MNDVGRESVRGLTLLELVAVMMLIAVTLAIAEPSLRGYFKAASHEQFARRVLGLTHKARAMAGSEGHTYFLVVDEGEGAVEIYSPTTGAGRGMNASVQRVEIPEGYEVQIEADDQAAGEGERLTLTAVRTEENKDEKVEAVIGGVVAFEPGGGNTPAVIRIEGHPKFDYLVYSEAYTQPYAMAVEEK